MEAGAGVREEEEEERGLGEGMGEIVVVVMVVEETVKGLLASELRDGENPENMNFEIPRSIVCREAF